MTSEKKKESNRENLKKAVAERKLKHTYGITFPKWRNESIKAYGNAVVPQVVYEIFKAIEEWENKY